VGGCAFSAEDDPSRATAVPHSGHLPLTLPYRQYPQTPQMLPPGWRWRQTSRNSMAVWMPRIRTTTTPPGTVSRDIVNAMIIPTGPVYPVGTSGYTGSCHHSTSTTPRYIVLHKSPSHLHTATLDPVARSDTMHGIQNSDVLNSGRCIRLATQIARRPATPHAITQCRQ